MTDSTYIKLTRRNFDLIQDNAEAIFALADSMERKLFNLFELLENPVLLEDKTSMLGMALAIKQLSDPIAASVDEE